MTLKRKYKYMVRFPLVCLVCACFGYTTHAQKIQLKKGIISNDDQPIAKLEGAAKLASTDITLKSLTDAPLVHVTRKIMKYGSMFHSPADYYIIDFTPINKTAHLACNSENAFTSEKKLLQYFFDTIGENFMTKDGLNESVVNTFIDTKDQTQQISRDTVNTFALIRKSRKKLNEPVISRDINAPVNLRFVSKNTLNTQFGRTVEVFDAYQGNQLIGRVVKERSGDTSVPGSSTTAIKSVEYIVLRRVPAFDIDGKSIEFVNLGKFTGSDTSFSADAECSKAWARDIKPADPYGAEEQITYWLVEKGCL